MIKGGEMMVRCPVDDEGLQLCPHCEKRVYPHHFREEQWPLHKQSCLCSACLDLLLDGNSLTFEFQGCMFEVSMLFGDIVATKV